MEINESGLSFTFDETTNAVKFDDTNFYRKYYNRLPSGKGVDIIATNKKHLLLIEIKNCSGHEADNAWRTSSNNSKVSQDPNDPNGHFGEDSFDIEVAKKVASTISCLYGAWTKQSGCESAAELEPLWVSATRKTILSDKTPVFVILVLEGNFGSKTRTKRAIMKTLQDSILAKLSWLNCRVAVVDSATYRRDFFTIEA